MLKKTLFAAAAIIVTVFFVFSCRDNGPGPTDNNTPFAVAASGLERNRAPAVAEADYEALLDGTRECALDLYARLRDQVDDNLFFSPYSISVALAMTYAGARGTTAREMADALSYSLDNSTLHPAFNRLDLYLTDLGQDSSEEEFVLSVANEVWGEKTYTFREDFLDLLAVNYGAAMYLLDFAGAPDTSRETINRWVEKQTDEKIKNLLPPGAISSQTRLVLTNAIYFYGAWLSQFEEHDTAEGGFTTRGGSEVTVPFMTQVEQFGYMKGNGFQAIDLPYKGSRAGMVIIIPDSGSFEQFEQSFDTEALESILQTLSQKTIRLFLPKWQFESPVLLNEPLSAMGIQDAFMPGAADFSGIDGTRDLFVSAVYHKGFVSVDELGTEAAAATAVVIELTSLPEPEATVRADRPFIFVIRDYETETVLFMGRVTDPSL